MWRMWEHRNQVNSSGLTAQDLRERAGLLSRLHQEFRKRRFLDPEDCHILGHEPTVRTWSNPEIQDWLDSVFHARAACARRLDRQARALQNSQRCMARWRAGIITGDLPEHPTEAGPPDPEVPSPPNPPSISPSVQ